MEEEVKNFAQDHMRESGLRAVETYIRDSLDRNLQRRKDEATEENLYVQYMLQNPLEIEDKRMAEAVYRDAAQRRAKEILVERGEKPV